MKKIKYNFIKNKKILVTGGAGFIGQHVVKNLLKKGVSRENIIVPRSKNNDLRLYSNCKKVVDGIDIVIHLAGNVGGIGYNMDNPGELFYDNIIMGVKLIEASRKAGVKKFVSVGTVCSYPKITKTPFKEKDLWSGYPEETNAPYGLAKKMLIVQGRAYRKQYNFNSIDLLLANSYGPNDRFDDKRSHVIPAIIKKVEDAKEKKAKYIELWGSGTVTREFIYVEDAAEAIVLATEKYEDDEPINIGSGKEISIKHLVKKITKIMKYGGKIKWKKNKPDGQPKRRLDTSKIKKLGFLSRTKMDDGLKKTVEYYRKIRNL